jgi:transcriptional regulator with XRE-family HTH domain
MADISGEPFPLEELIGKAPDEGREAFIERSAAFEAGDLVRAMRERAGFTQKELAQRIATSQSHLSEIERGNGLQGPTFSMLRKIAAACKVELRIEFDEDSFLRIVNEMGLHEKVAVASALGVSVDEAPGALAAARARARATLQVGNVSRLTKNGVEAIRHFASWLRQVPMS